jgi:hypothetical protein
MPVFRRPYFLIEISLYIFTSRSSREVSDLVDGDDDTGLGPAAKSRRPAQKMGPEEHRRKIKRGKNRKFEEKKMDKKKNGCCWWHHDADPKAKPKTKTQNQNPTLFEFESCRRTKL